MLIIVEGLFLALFIKVTAGWRNGVRLPAARLLTDAVPHHVNDLLVVHALEDAIAPHHEEVEVVLEFEGDDFWLTYDYIWISTISLSFGFDITESS